jgi:beta-galactosidase
VAIKDAKILVNGQPVIFKGVNRHEHSPDTAKHVPRELMEKDVQVMKRFNVNSVRTSHYPNHPDWYELCDRYGLYVMDEANIETHGYGSYGKNRLSNDPEWGPAYLDRVQRMYERDKNHASIVMWSMGNESGDGPNVAATYKWIKQRDPAGRPFHYEGSTGGGGSNSDINSFMYPTPRQTAEHARKRPNMPLLLCEYTHAMGNSNGGLKEYWDLFYSGKNMRGAYVWDWVDQGIRRPVPAGHRDPWGRRTLLAYGGWWEDKVGVRNDNNFCMNGLVNADREPHPGLHAIKYVYRYVHAAAVDVSAGKIRIKNWHDFVNAKDVVDGFWKVEAEGLTVGSGKLPPLDLAPYEEKEYTIPMPAITPQPGVDYWLNLSFVTKAASSWAPAGHEVSWEQFPLTLSAPRPQLDMAQAPPLKLADAEKAATLSGPSFSMVLDKQTGRISSYTYKGVKLIQRGPEPDFWRAPTDNDIGAWKGIRDKATNDPKRDLNRWREIGSSWNPSHVSVTRIDEKQAKIVASGELPDERGTYAITYTVSGDGDVIVEASYQPGKRELAMMPRFGMELVLAPGLTNMSWYGRGPIETYQDRAFERVGVYRSTVDKQWVDYSQPQENGNKSDVRWVALTNAAGVGLLAVGNPALGVRASHFTKKDVEESDYSFKLTRKPEVYLNLDLEQMGVGGIDSWSMNAYPMEPYRIPAKQPHSYRYRLTPVSGDPAVKARFAY